MSGNRLFNPADSLSIRDPVSNEKENGNIVNPPRFAEFGGFSSASRGLTRNNQRIIRPGASTRQVPVK